VRAGAPFTCLLLHSQEEPAFDLSDSACQQRLGAHRRQIVQRAKGPNSSSGASVDRKCMVPASRNRFGIVQVRMGRVHRVAIFGKTEENCIGLNAVTITFDEDDESLLVDGQKFEMSDDGSFEVLASRLQSVRLRDLPVGCSIVLCDRVIGSHELFRRSPNCTFECTKGGPVIAHGETAFFLGDDADIDATATAEYFTACVAKGKAALAPLIEDGTLLSIEERIYDEIAYLVYSIQIADQGIVEAESFMAAIEERIHDDMERPLMFICHATEDKLFVEQLVAALDRHALHAWFDKREIFVGDSIVGKINDALSQTRYIVPVLSFRSVVKPWVLRELNSSLMRQLSDEGIRVLPVLLDNCQLPPLLADIKYADFRVSFDQGFAELLRAIRR